MNDIKILLEFTMSHFCNEELKTVNRLEKYFILCIGFIGNRKAILGSGREESTYTDIIEEFTLSDNYTTIFTTK